MAKVALETQVKYQSPQNKIKNSVGENAPSSVPHNPVIIGYQVTGISNEEKEKLLGEIKEGNKMVDEVSGAPYKKIHPDIQTIFPTSNERILKKMENASQNCKAVKEMHEIGKEEIPSFTQSGKEEYGENKLEENNNYEDLV